MFLNLPSLGGYSLASILNAHPASGDAGFSLSTPSGASSSHVVQKPEVEGDIDESAESAGRSSAAAPGGPMVEFKNKPNNERYVA